MSQLAGLSLQELLSVKIISVGKREQSAFQAPAALAVITQDDIQRSGATSIPEALRLAPGIQVGQINANTWAISSRGFNTQFTDKLLVLIDGRTVFNSVFGGVFWDTQDYVLEDIERIEVIRGPGGTVWGANAVSGVINIITKRAKHTQGLLATVSAGTIDEVHVQLRFGGSFGEDANYRVYLKGFKRSDFYDIAGGRSTDEWHQFRGGLRLEWAITEADELTLSGDGYGGESGGAFATMPNTPGVGPTPGPAAPGTVKTFDDGADLAGGNILARWSHTFASAGSTSAQFYWDRRERDNELLDTTEQVFDIDFQYSAAEYRRNLIILGGGYRNTEVTSGNPAPFSLGFDSDETTFELFNMFIQDEIAAIPDVLNLTLGIKLEHQNTSGWQFMPSARAAWMADDHNTLWAAYSRGVASLSLRDVALDAHILPPGLALPPPGLGGARVVPIDLVPWVVHAFEGGWRVVPVSNVSIDLSAYYNRYNRIAELVVGPLPTLHPGTTHADVPAPRKNSTSGYIWGLEVAASWQVVDTWRLRFNYSYLDMNLELYGGSTSPLNDQSAKHMITLWTRHDLPFNLHLDGILYWYDSIPGRTVPIDNLGGGVAGIGDVFRLDLRVAWSPTDWVELSLTGQNLNDNKHKETTGFLHPGTVVPRSVYAKVAVTY